MEGVSGHRLQPAVAAIAVEALSRGEGAALPTNVEFLSRYGLGAGTMQRALATLRASDAVVTISRGHLGRFIERVGVAQCWQLAALPPVRMLLPPGGPQEIDALDQQIAEQITLLGVPYTVHHLRGGMARVRALQDGDHELAVVSSAAWASMDVSLPARRLPAGTYYGPGQLVLVSRHGEGRRAWRRVGIDSESPDHTAFTRDYFAEPGRSLVEVPSPEIPAAVLRGDIDVGLWHLAPSVIPLELAGLDVTPVVPDALAAAWAEASAAVLVASDRRPELRAVLERIDIDRIVAAQSRALGQPGGCGRASRSS
jgi:hypothetical protein